MATIIDPFGRKIITSASEEEAKQIERKIHARYEFSKFFAKEKGWDIENLTIEQIIEIRKDPRWEMQDNYNKEIVIELQNK